MIEPRAVLRPAELGQVRGMGPLAASDGPHPNYVKAAAMAADKPGTHIIVHEYSLVDVEGDELVQLERHVATEVRGQQIRLNRANPGDDGAEHYKVSSTKHTGDEVYRTAVVYYATGHPIRRRGARLAATPDAGPVTDAGHGLDAGQPIDRLAIAAGDGTSPWPIDMTAAEAGLPDDWFPSVTPADPDPNAIAELTQAEIDALHPPEPF